MNLTDLKRLPVPDLLNMAQEMGLENLARSRKQEVIAAVLRKHA
jgi:transcription termination factor Rho